ncbi:MAG: hypothetical protein M3419_07005 [Actinomycetota bacterium]|nr:hypothetical protein [Actinomycetota bacterium]
MRCDALADLFAAARRNPGDRADAYFDGAGKNLLSGLLLAVAFASRQITRVYLWVTDSTNDDPAEILRTHGYDLRRPRAGCPERRPQATCGVYGTAEKMAAFLTNRTAAAWTTPPTAAGVAELDPRAFVRSPDTLYSVSREGAGSAGALVAALTRDLLGVAQPAGTQHQPPASHRAHPRRRRPGRHAQRPGRAVLGWPPPGADPHLAVDERPARGRSG